MAHLLLSWRRMKVWALLPLLLSSGCLFLDGLNRPPTVSLGTQTPSVNKGTEVVMGYSVTDDESDEKFVMKFTVADADTGAPLDVTCDYDGFDNGASYNVRFFRAGHFVVTAVAFDRHGSMSSTASSMITISDAPPAFSSDAKVVPTSARDACDLNAAGDTITLGLKGQIADVDAGGSGANLACGPGEKLTYTWRIAAQPSGTRPVLTLYDAVARACVDKNALSGSSVVAPDDTTQVCLWTDAMINGAVAMYSVVLDVSDGTTTTTSPAGDVPVGADEPPCITGTEPIAGSYVVDRSAMQTFDVDGVKDDRDLFGTDGILYVWSLWRESDPTWRTVPLWSTSTYQLDVSSFGVGENVRVRVEAVDRKGIGPRATAAMCPVDADDCVVDSCASKPDVCHKWKTWDLELR
jgi:hypothetical protein